MTDHELPANLTEEEVERAREWASNALSRPNPASDTTLACRTVLDALAGNPSTNHDDFQEAWYWARRWLRSNSSIDRGHRAMIRVIYKHPALNHGTDQCPTEGEPRND